MRLCCIVAHVAHRSLNDAKVGQGSDFSVCDRLRCGKDIAVVRVFSASGYYRWLHNEREICVSRAIGSGVGYRITAIENYSNAQLSAAALCDLNLR